MSFRNIPNKTAAPTTTDKSLHIPSSQKNASTNDTKDTKANIHNPSVVTTSGATAAATPPFEDCPEGVDIRPVALQSSTQAILKSLEEDLPPELMTALLAPTDDKDTISGDEKEFGSIEHKRIGDDAFKLFIATLNKSSDQADQALLTELKQKNLFQPATLELTLSNQIRVTPGSIVCLAGDFYGPEEEDQIISFGATDEQKEARFTASYKQLSEAKPTEVAALLKTIDSGEKAIADAIKQGKKPSVALMKADTENDKAFAKITALSKYTFLPYFFYHNRYLALAKHNFDHFGHEAKEAYKAGHRVAWATAEKAKASNNVALFVEAFAQELFACHYLTDLFAAGHIRTPRKALYDYVTQESYFPGKLAIAGLLAKEMHDEECQLGLMVSSRKHYAAWKALGDDCYFDPDNKTNSEEVIKAVVAGLQDIYKAYRGSPAQYYSALAFVPTVDEEEKETPQPLFKKDSKENSVLKVRKDVNNPQCSEYESNWTPIRVLLERRLPKKKTDGVTEALTKAEQQQLQQELEDLATTKAAVECKLM